MKPILPPMEPMAPLSDLPPLNAAMGSGQGQSQTQGTQTSTGLAPAAMSRLEPVTGFAPAPALQAYTVDHLTAYAYAAPVLQSWQLARLTPRVLPWQTVLQSHIDIQPFPDERQDITDSFGNTVTHFGLHSPHRELSVRMSCHVLVGERPRIADESGPGDTWEAVRDALRRPGSGGGPGGLLAARLVEPTRLLPLSPAARRYAAGSLRPGRPWLEAVTDLMCRIHEDFEFDPHATTVSTSVDEVLAHRRGVCQDFAHLMLACLRDHGLSARYVSGYLLTDPPEGQPRLMGVDASHAWVAAWSPRYGWVEFDPTNRQRADNRYITLAWGADFADVAPLRGVILGGGDQDMLVQVSVLPV
jgi:transglutaminase-like putative cysteine protease